MRKLTVYLFNENRGYYQISERLKPILLVAKKNLDPSNVCCSLRVSCER